MAGVVECPKLRGRIAQAIFPCANWPQARLRQDLRQPSVLSRCREGTLSLSLSLPFCAFKALKAITSHVARRTVSCLTRGKDSGMPLQQEELKWISFSPPRINCEDIYYTSISK